MRSHVYADKLKKLADFLLSKPEFEAGTEQVYAFFSYYEKPGFLAAIRASGAGKKEFSGESIYFFPEIDDGIHFRIEAPRNLVCRKIKEAVWDCEPLLSPEDMKTFGEDSEAEEIPF